MALNFQVCDFYQWSIWRKRYQLELTLRALLQIFERPKTCMDPPFLYVRPTERWSFWAANSIAICKRIGTFPLNGLHCKKFVRTGGVYLVWTVQRACWKKVSRKNNEGKGYGVRAVETPIMVHFNKSSFRILPLYQILVNPMNGLFWPLLSTVYYLMEMRSDSEEIIS